MGEDGEVSLALWRREWRGTNDKKKKKKKEGLFLKIYRISSSYAFKIQIIYKNPLGITRDFVSKNLNFFFFFFLDSKRGGGTSGDVFLCAHNKNKRKKKEGGGRKEWRKSVSKKF